ncbi:MAG TPA: hypothetical protein DHV14_12215 [Micrococcales bacterium]|uniref:DUF7657 domain-containing protein n=1 Tax=Miniimonas arenae TaxID=676201 RepID=UPI000EE3BC33|nr:hypothetical protein [Miniimonas arenae]HCX85873.1 hypothetical protein [Micrococcales bacterium]
MTSADSPSRWSRARLTWSRLTTPRPDGLPNWRVLLAGPALLLVLGVALVLTGLNGSSSAAMRSEISSSPDPDLVAGAPVMIRTDEWNVQTVWAIAQAQQGLPDVNESFIGGMDATVPQDLPRADWSVAFRPHLLGFLFLDIDRAVALKWWLPALGLLAAGYCFAVTLLPRRPVLAAGLSLAFYLSPLLHWWFLQTTLWPPAWGFVVLTTVVWCLRARSWRPRIAWSAALAYLTPVMAMGIYVPFIQPVALVAALGGAGLAISAVRDGLGWRETLRRLSPVAAAGVAGAAVVLVWLGGRRATIDAFLSTTYPGDRSFPSGQGGVDWLVWTFSSSFARALKQGEWYGTNQSEASTFFLAGLFLLPVVAWLTVQRSRSHERLPWLALGGAAAMVLVFAFQYVPGWDTVARIMLFDQVLPNRLRMGLGFASIVVVVALARDLSHERRPGWVVCAIGPVAYLGSQILIAAQVRDAFPGTLAAAQYWKVLAVLGALALLLLARAHLAAGVSLLLVVGAVTTYDVNPLYRGVFDLRETPMSQAIVTLDGEEPAATWVGVGGRLPTALLLESGVTGFNGFQGAPSEEMWSLIDPDDQFEDEWNRLAGVSWTAGPGEPVVANPAPDQILVTFDGCSTFAQENVDFVLSDSSVSLDPSCLAPVESFDVASGSLTIWEVIPAA